MSSVFEHNIPVYKNLEETLKKSRMAIVVSATGTGKTHLVMEYITQHKLKALVVCPTYAIMAQWARVSDSCDLTSYSKFSHMTPHALADYDAYIFDEAHHAASPVWGKAFKDLADSTDKIIIGLTADPVRYSDGYNDVSQTVFGGNVVYGYSLAEAVEARVLPVGEYVCALYNIENTIKSVKTTSVESKLLAKLEMTVDNIGSITDILHRHMPAGWRKGIVFSDRISSIPEIESVIHNAFPKAKISIVHSDMTRKQVDRIMAQFSKSRVGYLIAVDMLNEGVHFPYVNTVIMFRRTASPSIFAQQIGRCLMPGNKKVIMFDFVGNHKSLRMSYEKRARANKTVPPRRFDLPRQTIIHDYIQPVEEVLEEIECSLSNKWTPAEDALLIAHYPTEGSKCAHLFPKHSLSSVLHRAAFLGLRKLPKWTPAMDNILKDYYKTDYMKARSLLTAEGFTLNAIRARANALGLCSAANWHVWTPAEDDILRQYYPTEGYAIQARLPGLTIDTILTRVRLMGLKVDKYKGKWTPEEVQVLKDHFQDGLDSVAALLPGRSRKAIMTKSELLGLRQAKVKLNYTRRKWTPAEDDILRQYWPAEGKTVASRLADRTQHSVAHRAAVLGLSKAP